MQDVMATKKYFLDMVGAVICDRPVPICSDNIDLNKLYKLSVKNAVQGILYIATTKGAVKLPTDLTEKLKKSYMATLMREASQVEEIEFIRKSFSENQIEFMLLKGSHLKALYPIPEIRFMVDMDVLVHENDMNKGRDIILSRGFKQEMNNGKDIVLIKEPMLTVELHKMLFVEGYFMHQYFSNVWDRVEKVSEFEYKMPINDLYVYTLAHLAEHYLEAGSCFRPMMDLYLMHKHYENELDFEYIYKQFEEIGIEDFAKNIANLYHCMFDGADYDDTLTMMENFIVLGAPVKNANETSKIAVENKSKTQKIIEKLFPSYKVMILQYEILKKIPILLPFFWFVRIIKKLFKFNDSSTRYEKFKNVQQKDVDIMKEIFEKSGLK